MIEDNIWEETVLYEDIGLPDLVTEPEDNPEDENFDPTQWG